MPRIHTTNNFLYGQEKIEKPKVVRDAIMILKEHNRFPGTFDYNYPQDFYSTFPEIEYDSYYTIGGSGKRRVFHDENQVGNKTRLE